VNKPDFKDDIAVIGILYRSSMAKDIKEFFNNLEFGKDCITPVPEKSRKDFFHLWMRGI
jgi:acyl transferase domain-containing protein